MIQKPEYLHEAVMESGFLLRSLQQLIIDNGEDAQLINLEDRARKLLIELLKLEKHVRNKSQQE